MKLTTEQIKGRIKSIARSKGLDARVLLRIYMMERFLERVTLSIYRDNFIIKGGMLITSMVGVTLRSTMDIDTTVKNQQLSKEHVIDMINEIISVEVDDNIDFVVKATSEIMSDMEYPGVRLYLEARIAKMVVPIKIDVSTGDVIIPAAIKYKYKLLLEERTINLWAYSLETILAEKLQTILVRGLLNTRIRDFYDIRTLLLLYGDEIDNDIFKKAFDATCLKRNMLKLKENGCLIVEKICEDRNMRSLWDKYTNKYDYSENISYDEVIESLFELLDRLK